MNIFNIRKCQLADLDAILKIEQTLQLTPWSLKQFSESVVSHQFTVIEKPQTCEIIGYCILQPVATEANLLLMGIDIPFQNKGLGLWLLNHSIDLLNSKVEMIFLEVRKSNFAAQKLYEKAGFVEVGVRKNYYDAQANAKEDAIVMAVTLANNFAQLFQKEG